MEDFHEIKEAQGAKYIGATALLILITVLGLIILIDLPNLLMAFHMGYSNIKSWCVYTEDTEDADEFEVKSEIWVRLNEIPPPGEKFDK